MLRELWRHADKIEKDFFTLRPEQCVINPLLAELVGAKLMAALGLGHTYCKIVSRDDARSLNPREWIFKSEGEGGGLHACYTPHAFSSVVLAVGKIPRAVPLSFLRARFGIGADYPVIESGRTRFTLNGVLWKGKDDPPNAAEFYADFVPPADWSAVRAAIAWDSEPMLRIHSARLFLSATCAHASNILVNAQGQLFSIDHADVALTDHSEIDMLFANVKPGTRAWESLHPICTLEEKIVRDIFQTFEGKSAEHYLDRLRKWKRLFAEATLRAA